MVFGVTVIKWAEHNKKHKKGMGYFKFSNGFLTDQSIANCRPIDVILFIHCLCVASESSTDRIRISNKTLPKQLRMGDTSLTNGLERLKQLQLVTFEKEPLIKGNSIKLKDIKLNSIPVGSDKKVDAAQPPKPAAPEKTNLVIAKYCDLWRARYKSEKSPPVLPQHCAIMKKIVTTVGQERALLLVEAYFKMPDSWYVTKRHDIPTLMGNLNAVTQFAESGRMFSKRELNQLDLAITNKATHDALERNEV